MYDQCVTVEQVRQRVQTIRKMAEVERQGSPIVIGMRFDLLADVLGEIASDEVVRSTIRALAQEALTVMR